MKTVHIGSVLLATTVIAGGSLSLPSHSKDKPVASTQRISKKSVLLSVSGMH
jgi:hypothetical protein